MTKIEEVLTLLEDERQALVSGDLAALDPLLRRKEALAVRLKDFSGADVRTLARVSRLSARNGDLLAAARRGLERAEAQIGGLRTGMAQTTYDRDGSKRPMSRLPGRVEHKL